MGKKMSVILPVYNVEKYLDRCMKSIMCQTMKPEDFEVILVDDGSPDACGSMCDEFARLYDNVFVIHQKNKGAAGARNAGFKASGGEYVCFVDPDDYLEPDYLSASYNNAKAKDADILIFDALRETKVVAQKGIELKVSSWNHAEKSFETTSLEDKRSMQCQILYPFMAASAGEVRFGKNVPLSAPWDKCYKRSFLSENGLMFPEKLRVLDDMCFNYICFGKAGKIVYLPRPLYHYCIEEGSITNSFKSDRVDLDKQVFEYIKNEGFDSNELYQAYLSRIIKSFAICCRLCFFNDKNTESSANKLLAVRKCMISYPYNEAFENIKLLNLEWKLVAVAIAGKLKSPGLLKLLHHLQNG